MIDISKLTDADVNRSVVYRKKEYGRLTGWNEKYIFVKFRGLNGEACNPADVSFEPIRDHFSPLSKEDMEAVLKEVTPDPPDLQQDFVDVMEGVSFIKGFVLGLLVGGVIVWLIIALIMRQTT